MKSPGERIKFIRKKNNLTQEELATILDSTKTSISRYERDLSHMETYTLIKFCLHLNVSSDYILGLSDEDTSVKSTEKNRLDILNNINETKLNTLFLDEDYYWITKDSSTPKYGGQTVWDGYTEDGREIRVLRPVFPEKAKEVCESVYGYSPMIINSKNDVIPFEVLGGHALIRESICKQFLPQYLLPYIVE